MARMPRVHQPNGFYHAILRGNNKQDIFFANEDRKRWEELLVKAVDHYKAKIHAYCWMTNHIHVLIQVSEPPLANIMRYAASQYSRQTNELLGTTGHLFERRHRAFLVGDDSYLMRLVRYIHNNPVRANLYLTAKDYPWSSHCIYLGHRATSWLTTDFVLRMFADDRRRARLQYRRFMGEADADFDPCEQSEEIAADRLDSASDLMLTRTQSTNESITLEQIIAQQSERNGIAIAQLAGHSRVRIITRVRAEIAIQATEQGVATIADVARALGRSESAISQLISNHRASRSTKT